MATWRSIDDTETDLPSLIRLLNLRLGTLVSSLNAVSASTQGAGSFSNGALTPSVGGSNVWQVKNTVATNITTLKDGTPGQTVVLWSTTANTVLVNSAGFLMKSGANVAMTATDVRRFTTVDGTNWRES
jgi:hypothetical protein